jgi:alkylated DNA repair dioxygenase AlkB
MQKIGTMSEQGFSVSKLRELASAHDGELYDLSDLLTENKDPESSEAVVLVLRQWVQKTAKGADIALLEEQLSLTPDKKCLSRGKVVNKHARHNLCFSDTPQEADYEAGKGTIISYDAVPHLSEIKSSVEAIVGMEGLKCEGNYYYDTKKCYIGWHGDAERRKVVGLRLGPYRVNDGEIITEGSYPLRFRWYHKTKIVSETLTVNLSHGDIYIMSEKAVGTDWRKSSKYTLRHSAGDV